MKVKIILLCLVLFTTIQANSQSKKWYKNYWVGGNMAFLLSTETKATGFAINAGRNIKSFKVGLDFQSIDFTKFTRVKIVSLYLDKSIQGKKNQLYFYAQPGLAYIANGKKELSYISRYEYEASKPGMNLQIGSGIRWMVKQHSFYLRAGFNATSYTLLANDYPFPINPYNPFKEDVVVHKYTKAFNKIEVRLGFNL